MSPLVEEWAGKGMADLGTAKREARVRNKPNCDAVCFHAQQAIEKLLKAKLIASGKTVPRTHDLSQLLDLLLDVEPLWESWRSAVNEVSAYAVEFRYPGETATKDMASRALRCAERICREVRRGLDPHARGADRG